MPRSKIASKPRVTKCQKSGYYKTWDTQQFFQFFCYFTDKHQPERIQKNPWYFCISVCLIFHQFCLVSSTFCSYLAAFSWNSLKIKKHLAGMVISTPSLCSFWLVSRLCLNNDICTCVLFWGSD